LNNNTSVSALIYEIPNNLPEPLLNNATEARLSTKYMDIDYSSGQLSPTNQGVLITGSATKAPVQDYNWNVRRSTLPRYIGSKLTGAKVNVYTDGDISYGKEPVINNYQTSFLTFKEIRNAYPELVGKSTLWINSLVDKDGNQLAVDFSTGSNYYYNLIDNFGKDSQVNLQITTLPSGSSSNNLDLSTTVYRPALLWPSVILTNESGSKLNILDQGTFTAVNIDFEKSDQTFTQINKKCFTSIPTDFVQIFNVIIATSELKALYDFTFAAPGNFIRQDTSFIGGYDAAINFNLRVGQEIRFNQDENEVYIIKNISNNNITGLSITLDRDLTGNLHFDMLPTTSANSYPGILIREYQIDPSKLVINAPKLIGGAPGYLTPQYMSPDLIASLDKTVETLKENGIL
jgi:hypothetical protein